MDFLKTFTELAAAGQPFAFATVVRVEGSSSAKPGSKAIIDGEGKIVRRNNTTLADTIFLFQRPASHDGLARQVDNGVEAAYPGRNAGVPGNLGRPCRWPAHERKDVVSLRPQHGNQPTSDKA